MNLEGDTRFWSENVPLIVCHHSNSICCLILTYCCEDAVRLHFFLWVVTTEWLHRTTAVNSCFISVMLTSGIYLVCSCSSENIRPPSSIHASHSQAADHHVCHSALARAPAHSHQFARSALQPQEGIFHTRGYVLGETSTIK